MPARARKASLSGVYPRTGAGLRWYPVGRSRTEPRDSLDLKSPEGNSAGELFRSKVEMTPYAF